MSVINKMLRDLDQRQAGDRETAARDTVALGDPRLSGDARASWRQSPVGTSPRRTRPRVLLGLACVGLLVGAGWWFAAQDSMPRFLQMHSRANDVRAMDGSNAPVADLGATRPKAPAGEESLKPVPGVDATAGAMLPPQAQSDASQVSLRMADRLSLRYAREVLAWAPTRAVAQTPAPDTAVPLTTSPPAHGGLPSRSATSSAVIAGPAPTLAIGSADAPRSLQRQQQAGGDALAQAQNLWNTGEREAAIDLMEQSVAAAERAAMGSSGSANQRVLLSLVRELARMQLALGRFGPLWEALNRLEPVLGNEPDLWAIRANVAQRLGNHLDSAHAYSVALQSRPNEQRWLLGLAVSLAAQGRVTVATETAERARAVGPVRKEVLAYLRQAGVVLKE